MAAATIPGGLLPIVGGDSIEGGSPPVLRGDLSGGTNGERMRRWKWMQVLERAEHRSVARIKRRLRAECYPAMIGLGLLQAALCPLHESCC